MLSNNVIEFWHHCPQAHGAHTLLFLLFNNIIQILTGTVMKLPRFGGLPRELYFPKGFTEGKYCPEGKYTCNYLGTTDTWYFIRPGRYLLYQMVKMNDFLKISCALRLPRGLVTRLGVCVQNKTERKLDSLRAFYYDVLLLTTAYSVYAVHFFLG